MKMAVVLGLLGLILLQDVAAFSVFVTPERGSQLIHMTDIVAIPVSICINDTKLVHLNFSATSNSDIAIANVNVTLVESSDDSQVWNGTLNVTGIFLGTTKMRLIVSEEQGTVYSNEFLTVTVIRQERTIDSVFTASVAILVSVLYINYGCALDWKLCTKTLKRPIGPAIGCFCQFICMPLISYFIGYFLFPDQPELQIGMFFTGISPSGGASNIWTLLLGGNLNLSITMTTAGTIIAFAMMPFWIFTLGKHIFTRGDIVVPYSRILMFAVGLIIPLGIGWFIQKKFPRISKILVRIMKPCSAILIIFIVIFAIVTNLYLFKLFSLQILIAGMGLPWLGFIFGLIISLLFKQPRGDVIAIAIETGIQNTGVAIFLLRFTLEPPADDLTTVVPVSSAIMTPVPLMVLYAIKLILDKLKSEPGSDTSETKDERNLEPVVIPKSNSSKPLIHVIT